jgi:hypothetical protein
MGNLTITIDEDALKKARLRAIAQGTSVNAIRRVFPERYSGIRDDVPVAVDDTIALSKESRSMRGDVPFHRDERQTEK